MRHRAERGGILVELGLRDPRADHRAPSPVVDALHLPAPLARIGHDIAHVRLGGRHLDLHDRLEDRRTGRLGSLAEGDGTGELEGDVGRVDAVVGPVVALRPDVHDGVAGQDPLAGRLPDPPIHGGDEPPGDHAALDRIDELVSAPRGQRLEPDPAVSELSPAAALLLVASVGLRPPRDCLAVGDPRPLGIDLHAVLARHPLHLDVEMELSHPADDRLAQLGLVARLETGVLALEARERLPQLVVVAPGPPPDGQADIGKGEGDRVHGEVPPLLGERVVRERAPELCHDTDVPGVEHGHLGTLLSERDGEVVQLLLGAAAGIDDVRPVPDRSAADPEEREVPDVGLGDGLEDESGEGVVVGRPELDGILPLAGSRLRNGVDRAREEGDDPVEERAGARTGRGGEGKDGDDLVRPHRERERPDRLVEGELPLLEIEVQEILIEGGKRFLELGVPLLERTGDVCGNLRLLDLPLAVPSPEPVRAPVERVHGPREALARAYRKLDRHRLRGEPLPDGVEDTREVRMLLVHHRDDDEPGESALLAVLPHLLGPDLDARGRADHHNRRVGRVHRGQRLPGEVEVSRGIEEIDLVTLPLGECAGELHRHPLGEFLGAREGERVALGHIPLPRCRARGEAERVDERRLPRARVPEHGDIPDPIGRVLPRYGHLRSRISAAGGTARTAR